MSAGSRSREIDAVAVVDEPRALTSRTCCTRARARLYAGRRVSGPDLNFEGPGVGGFICQGLPSAIFVYVLLIREDECTAMW